VPGATYDSNSGGYVFDCNTALPDFIFGAGSYRGTIPGDYINYSPANSDGTVCFGGIQSSQGIGFSIFGDIALKAQFVVFDQGNQRLGWASKDL
jgi:hypothetical protein